MTLLATLALAGLVVENIEPQAREVSLQVIARIPKLTARQADALDAMVEAIPRDLEGYSRRDVFTVTDGDTVRCHAGPDYVRISFHVPPANWKAGLSLMETLVRRSKLTRPDSSAPDRVSAWVAALRPYERTRNPRPNDIADLYRTLFRPENLTLGVGGAIPSGAALQDWESRMSRWTPPRIQAPSKYEKEPKTLAKNPGGLSTIELGGPEFGSRDPAISTRILALMALGSGKGSSLFRVARQQLRLSYRQEALLYPTPDGWRSRLLLQTSQTADLPKKAEELRTGLLGNVKNWSELDLRRAQGIAEGVFIRGIDQSPFAFGPFGSFDDTLEGRTFLRTYWRLKTGEPWDEQRLLGAMRTVTLTDLKQTATEILTAGKTRVLPAG